VVLTTIEPDGSELLEQAVALGVAAVVKKPWKPQQLRRVLEGILR
jgi:AmiR/NasT family two-component response regulator